MLLAGVIALVAAQSVGFRGSRNRRLAAVLAGVAAITVLAMSLTYAGRDRPPGWRSACRTRLMRRAVEALHGVRRTADVMASSLATIGPAQVMSSAMAMYWQLAAAQMQA